MKKLLLFSFFFLFLTISLSLFPAQKSSSSLLTWWNQLSQEQKDYYVNIFTCGKDEWHVSVVLPSIIYSLHGMHTILPHANLITNLTIYGGNLVTLAKNSFVKFKRLMALKLVDTNTQRIEKGAFTNNSLYYLTIDMRKKIHSVEIPIGICDSPWLQTVEVTDNTGSFGQRYRQQDVTMVVSMRQPRNLLRLYDCSTYAAI